MEIKEYNIEGCFNLLNALTVTTFKDLVKAIKSEQKLCDKKKEVDNENAVLMATYGIEDIEKEIERIDRFARNEPKNAKERRKWLVEKNELMARREKLAIAHGKERSLYVKIAHANKTINECLQYFGEDDSLFAFYDMDNSILVKRALEITMNNPKQLQEFIGRHEYVKRFV